MALQFRLAGALAALCLGACQTAPATAEEAATSPLVRPDIAYGSAIIHATTAPEARTLTMDAYLPAGDGPHAAIILAHGGAFHRGSKGEETFYEDGASDSSMAAWCRAFAKTGYACFSIDYRLTPENPALGRDHDAARLFPDAMLDAPGATARIDFARTQMGLAPLDAETKPQYRDAILAAAEDMTMAVEHVRSHALEYDVDPARIALGGFSSGAITAINSAYGLDAPVQAVFALSGAVAGYNPGAGLPADPPPLLMFTGQNDLPDILLGSQYLRSVLSDAGAPPEVAWVPGFGHFYPMEAPSLGADLTIESVEARTLDFLERELTH
ncbi:MAG: hypothetical protein KDA53_07455 [Hyphomonas sp.]|nr:hypothetical protein [Hyphomonas sp.]